MRLLEKDRYLLKEKRAPEMKHSLEYLVTWRKTRELAEEEFTRGPERCQPTRITEFFGEKKRNGRGVCSEM